MNRRSLSRHRLALLPAFFLALLMAFSPLPGAPRKGDGAETAGEPGGPPGKKPFAEVVKNQEKMDGIFTLYEDQGDNYGYEKGDYATVTFRWEEGLQKLIIGKRQGSFPGMRQLRSLRIVWVGEGHGVGVDSTEKVDKVVDYQGEAMEVSAL